MPYCPDCGEEVDEGVEFCPNCGTSMQADSGTSGGTSVGIPSALAGTLLTQYRTLLAVLGGFLFLWIGQLVMVAANSFVGGLAIFQIGVLLLTVGLVGGGIDDNSIADSKQKVMIIMGVIALLILNLVTTFGAAGIGLVGGSPIP